METETSPIKKKYFYDDLFLQFDSLMNKIKNNLSINTSDFESIHKERNRLVNCKKDLNSALQILLSIESFKDSISLHRKTDVLQSLNTRYRTFEEVKELISIYHERLKAHFIHEDDIDVEYQNKSAKVKYLKMESKDNENDLTEHLLVEESRKALIETTNNLDETNSRLAKQKLRIGNLSGDLDVGSKMVSHSNKAVGSLSNNKFYTKLILHSIAILLGIAILAGLIIKLFYVSKSKDQLN